MAKLIIISIMQCLYCLVIARSDWPGFYKNLNTSVRDAFAQLCNCPDLNAGIVYSLLMMEMRDTVDACTGCIKLTIIRFRGNFTEYEIPLSSIPVNSAF